MKDDYKNFSELAEYAIWRFQKSVKRNDPIAAKYWLEVKEWAEERILPESIQDVSPHICYQSLLIIFPKVSKTNFNMAVRIYWQLKHARRMLINNGQKVPRLNLNWLRDWGERFSKEASAGITKNDISTAGSKQTDQVSALRARA